jgi:hypothetical protein
VSATHEMVLSGIAESGAEEWACPNCEWRILLRWPPECEVLVLDRGDESVSHVGGKNGVRVGPVEVTPVRRQIADRDRQWLRDNGIHWTENSA